MYDLYGGFDYRFFLLYDHDLFLRFFAPARNSNSTVLIVAARCASIAYVGISLRADAAGGA